MKSFLIFIIISLQGSGKAAPYYMGSTTSLPRGTTLLRTYSPAVPGLGADRIKAVPSGKHRNLLKSLWIMDCVEKVFLLALRNKIKVLGLSCMILLKR